MIAAEELGPSAASHASGAREERSGDTTRATDDDGLQRSALRTAKSILSLQRRAEEQLVDAQRVAQRQAETFARGNSLLQTTLDASPAGIVAIDRSARITAYNKKIADFWRVSEAMQSRRDFGEWSGAFVRHTKDALGVLSRLRQVVNAEYVPGGELPHARGAVEMNDGRSFEYEAAPQLHAGECIGVVLHWYDVTDRRRALAAQADLEEQLREAQKMESIGALAGGIAHDFNNILGAIIGNIVYAAQALDAAHPVAENLRAVLVASERATRLVQQILTFSRRQRQQVQRLSLGALLEEAAALLRATIPTGIDITVSVERSVPTVLGDPTQLHQVMMNLGTNAMNAVRERAGLDGGTGHLVLRVSSATMPDPLSRPALHGLPDGQYAVLVVSDDGVGMDASTRERMFEPFFTTRRTGTGLGLSVVHGIVAAHGGRVLVRTALGAGTTFELYFPQAADVAVVLTPQSTSTIPMRALIDNASDVSADGSRTDARDTPRKHVLVVDDEPMLVSIASRLLTRDGYRVSAFTDAAEALGVLRASPRDFDLVITDFNMPRMSGLEMAQAVRLIRPDVPIILSSGFLTQELEDEAIAAGVDVLVSKTDLVTTLSRVVATLRGSA
jgi:signal transduction histidine kinase